MFDKPNNALLEAGIEFLPYFEKIYNKYNNKLHKSMSKLIENKQES